MSSKILVSKRLFLKKTDFKWTLLHETIINRGTPSSFYINSPSIKTLSKLLQKYLKNIQKTSKNKQRRFIQIILPNFKVILESSPKASRKYKNFDQLKIHWIQAQKPQSAKNIKFLNKSKPRNSFINSIRSKNMFREAFELKSILKRRIRGTNEIVIYYSNQ